MGLPRGDQGNAIALARKPNYDRLISNFANTLIATSGLPWVCRRADGQQRSWAHEYWCGRVVHMDITKIDLMVANSRWIKCRCFKKRWSATAAAIAFSRIAQRCGVHSHIQHLFALLRWPSSRKSKMFCALLHGWRDTPPHSGREFVQRLQQKMRELGIGKIATLVGRYYAMDRDNRWERVNCVSRIGAWRRRNEDHRSSRR